MILRFKPPINLLFKKLIHYDLFMNKLYLLLLPLIVISCSKEIPREQLVERDGLLYEINSQTPFEGNVTTLFENGQLKSKSSYKQGYQSGSFETYYENGQLQSKGKINKDGSMFGDYENYHDNGQLESKGTFKEDGSSLIDGEYVIYHENGTPSHTWRIQDGKTVGNSDYYFDNGQLEQRIVFKNGVRQDGPFEIFNRDGQPLKRGTTKNGEIHGTYEKFGNGKLKEIWTYVEGEVDGPYKKFYSNGETQETGYYKKDPTGSINYFKDGVWKYFYDNGVLNKQESFKDQKKHGVWIQNYNDGSPSRKLTFKSGLLDGSYEYYDPITKNLKLTGFFNEHQPNGEWKQYWSNGNLRSKGNYEDGVGKEPWEEYDPNGKLLKVWKDEGYLTGLHSSGSPLMGVTYSIRSLKKEVSKL